MCSNLRMEQRKHWWNGRWGRIARRDIYVREDGGRWLVEHRVGGADGRSGWFECDDEEAALERVGALMVTGDGWQEFG
jgi:hypothetical protein